MALNIRVNDICHAVDTIPQAMVVIEKIITDWLNSDDDKPLTVLLTKNDNRGPPSLNIKVADKLDIREVLS